MCLDLLFQDPLQVLDVIVLEFHHLGSGQRAAILHRVIRRLQEVCYAHNISIAFLILSTVNGQCGENSHSLSLDLNSDMYGMLKIRPILKSMRASTYLP